MQVGRDIVAAEVSAAVDIDGAIYLVVNKFDHISTSRRLSQWRYVEHNLCLAEGDTILGPAIYRKEGDVVSVIRNV